MLYSKKLTASNNRLIQEQPRMPFCGGRTLLELLQFFLVVADDEVGILVIENALVDLLIGIAIVGAEEGDTHAMCIAVMEA